MNSDPLDLKSTLGLLRRRAGLIVVATALCLGLAGLTLLALKPVYSATALVLVDPSRKDLLDPDAQMTGSPSDALRVDSEVELVKSETTLLAVAAAMELAGDPEFGLRLGISDMLLALFRIAEPQGPDGDEALGRVMDNLRRAVSVQRRGLTYLIAVTARSGRPDVAARLANSVARTYIGQQLQAKIASTLESANILKQRMVEASTTVAQSERAFDEFIDRNLEAISESTGRTDLAQMQSEIASLNAFRAQSAAIAESAERSLAGRDWAGLAASLGDEAVDNLERQRVALLDSIAGVTVGSTADFDLRASLAGVEDELDAAAERAVGDLRSKLARSQGRISDLRNQLRTSILASNLSADILTSIYELQQAAEVARAQYQTLLTRQQDLDTQAYLQVADSRIVSEATAPQTPSFPNPALILMLAGLVGVGVGIGLVFLTENFVGGFTSGAQAEAILKVPVVSALPRQRTGRRGEGESGSVADALFISPLSAFSESIRRARIGIDQAVRKRRTEADAEGGTVIVVTSAAPDEGKTTVALSLARAYALAGMSTLLIDCDLRKPGVHRQLGIEPSEGLLEYLSGRTTADLNSILTVDAASGAHVVVGSRRSDIPTDQLIAGKTFARLIAAARMNFDIVLLDTPPVGPVVDGLYLAGMADAIGFIVKFSNTPQQEVRAAMAALTGAKGADAPILTILNQQTNSPAAYRGKYAGYYAEAK